MATINKRQFISGIVTIAIGNLAFGLGTHLPRYENQWAQGAIYVAAIVLLVVFARRVWRWACEQDRIERGETNGQKGRLMSARYFTLVAALLGAMAALTVCYSALYRLP